MTLKSKNLALLLGMAFVIVTAIALFMVGYSSSSAATPVGATSQDARQFSISVNFTNATSTFIQNNTGNDLFVTATKLLCTNVGTSNTSYTGVGLASWQFTVGTTSTNVTGTATIRSFAPTMNNFAVSTSTGNLEVASTTLVTATSSNAAIWNAGSYMAFQTNATNTAQCTVGVDVTST